jgi:glycosyltransferase involved in cell wall biosynthesis
MRQPKVSIVIAALNEGENLVDTVHCILRNSDYPGLEVLVVDDGSTDGSGWRLRSCFHDHHHVHLIEGGHLGVARARNQGAAMASGEVLVFLDGHCYTPPGWLQGLIAPLEDPAVGMVGPAFASLGEVDGPRGYGAIWGNPMLEIEWLPRKAEMAYEVPLHPGGCQAVRGADFQALGGYDAGMARWGSEGEELSLRYWLMGFEVVVQPAVVLHHLFRKRHPYQVQPPKVIYNRLRMATMHFGSARLGELIQRLSGTGEFPAIVQWLLESDASFRREELLLKRKRDDEWFFSRFADSAYSPELHPSQLPGHAMAGDPATSTPQRSSAS